MPTLASWRTITSAERQASDGSVINTVHGHLPTPAALLGLMATLHAIETLTVYTQDDPDFPTVPDHRSDLASSHTNLGELLKNQGKGADAEEQFKKGLALREKLAADFPAVPDYRRDLAGSHHNLGVLLADLGKRAEAEEQTRVAAGKQGPAAEGFRQGSEGHGGHHVRARAAHEEQREERRAVVELALEREEHERVARGGQAEQAGDDHEGAEPRVVS